MENLNKEMLLNINGGLSISGSLVNAFTKAINSIFEVGRSLGGAIRRINNGNLCSLK